MRHHVRPFLSLLVLVCYLNACTTWQVQTAPTSSVLTNYAGDTIVGRGRDTTAVAIPLQEVREVAVKRTSVPRTALLIVGMGAVAGGLALVAICAEYCND